MRECRFAWRIAHAFGVELPNRRSVLRFRLRTDGRISGQTIAQQSTEDEVNDGSFEAELAAARSAVEELARAGDLSAGLTSTLEDIVRLMDTLFYRLESEVDTLRTEIRGGIERLVRLEGKVDAGFERIERRLGDTETRVEGVKHRVTALEARP